MRHGWAWLAVGARTLFQWRTGIPLWHSGDFPPVWALIGCTLSGAKDASQWNANPWPPSGLTGLELVQSHNSYLSLWPPLLLLFIHCFVEMLQCHRENNWSLSSVWPGVAFFFFYGFFPSPKDHIHTELHISFCLCPIHHLSWDLHLACSLCLNFTGVHPRACATSTWKTRSNPSGLLEAWSVLISHTHSQLRHSLRPNSRKLHICFGTKHIIFPHLLQR